MLDNHDGGCLCGKARYTVYGQPVRAGVCHCRYCQLRAGSAFGTLVYFSLENCNYAQGIYPSIISELRWVGHGKMNFAAPVVPRYLCI